MALSTSRSNDKHCRTIAYGRCHRLDGQIANHGLLDQVSAVDKSLLEPAHTSSRRNSLNSAASKLAVCNKLCLLVLFPLGTKKTLNRSNSTCTVRLVTRRVRLASSCQPGKIMMQFVDLLRTRNHKLPNPPVTIHTRWMGRESPAMNQLEKRVSQVRNRLYSNLEFSYFRIRVNFEWTTVTISKARWSLCSFEHIDNANWHRTKSSRFKARIEFTRVQCTQYPASTTVLAVECARLIIAEHHCSKSVWLFEWRPLITWNQNFRRLDLSSLV